MRSGEINVSLITDRVVCWMTEFGERRLISSLLYDVNMIDAKCSQPRFVSLFRILARKRTAVFAELIGMVEQILGTITTNLNCNIIQVEANEKYWRCEVCISIIAEIYIYKCREEVKEHDNAFDGILPSESIEENDEDEIDTINIKVRAFSILYDHIYCENASVRACSIKMFETIIRELPLPQIGSFQDRILSRFNDKSSVVRKSAVTTFLAIIRNNKLIRQLQNISLLRKQAAETRQPTVRKSISLLLDDCEKIISLIDTGSEILMSNYLLSSLPSDVLMTINWFYQIRSIGIHEGTRGGFRRMLTHVCNSEKSIRDSVICCFKDICFSESYSGYQTATGLIRLVEGSTCAESVSIRKLIQLIKLPQEARREIYEFAFGQRTRCVSIQQRAVAMSIIEMVSHEKPEEIDAATVTSLIAAINDQNCPPLVLTEVFNVISNLRKNANTLLSAGAYEKNNAIFTATTKRIKTLLRSNFTHEMNNMLLAMVRMYYLIRKCVIFTFSQFLISK